MQQQHNGSFVKPVIVNAPPPQVEERPTFRGEINSGRIVVFFAFALILAIGAGWLAYSLNLETVPMLLISMLVLAGSFVPLYRWDAQISTGYLHKLREQETEQLRIDASMLDAVAINREQSEQLTMIWEEIRRLDERLNTFSTLQVRDINGARVIPKVDAIEMSIQRWLTQSMFDSAGRLVGTHPNMQIKSAMPFKESSQDEDIKKAYRRLIAAGLVGKQGNNYTWTGPGSLSQTIRRLQEVKPQ